MILPPRLRATPREISFKIERFFDGRAFKGMMTTIPYPQLHFAQPLALRLVKVNQNTVNYEVSSTAVFFACKAPQALSNPFLPGAPLVAVVAATNEVHGRQVRPMGRIDSNGEVLLFLNSTISKPINGIAKPYLVTI